MSAATFYVLLLTSAVGLAVSFFLSKPLPFLPVLLISLIFPIVTAVKAILVVVKRKMIMSYIIEEIHNSTLGVSNDLTRAYGKAVKSSNRMKAGE